MDSINVVPLLPDSGNFFDNTMIPMSPGGLFQTDFVPASELAAGLKLRNTFN